ncbi:MAG: hypothetical protein DI629_03080 [Mesorhizobium amorphae]|nr:MAG: hypothetical protein DI629_03080 [Mesorhizobium amorphae]
MTPERETADRYFRAVDAALAGLGIFLRDDRTVQRHDLVAAVVGEHLERLQRSFLCWRDRLDFAQSFRINRAESGFPVFQTVLELESDRRTADKRLGAIPEPQALRDEMADFILRQKAFPSALRQSMAERLYLQRVKEGQVFGPLTLARTVRVSTNPKTGRPLYVVHWASFDGTANLPLVYMLTVEDSSPDMVRQLVDGDGKLNTKVEIPLPVEGLLNPELALPFDDWTAKNSAYTLSPVTIAGNCDKDFPTLHPKQLRRFVLGPFYGAGLTENNSIVSEVLSKVRRPEGAWLLTWTMQEVFSIGEKAGRRGLWSSEPSSEQFHIETSDPEGARQGVSAYEKHALVPHEAYQALYASGEAAKIFSGYKVHILSGDQVISDV